MRYASRLEGGADEVEVQCRSEGLVLPQRTDTRVQLIFAERARRNCLDQGWGWLSLTVRCLTQVWTVAAIHKNHMEANEQELGRAE